jgi:hypothetical protein
LTGGRRRRERPTADPARDAAGGPADPARTAPRDHQRDARPQRRAIISATPGRSAARLTVRNPAAR